MLRTFTKKRVVVALSVVAALVVTGVAVAYFTSTGSGSGTASVGKSTNFTVTVGAPSGQALYPGLNSQTFDYTIKNESGSGTQNLSATDVSIAADPNGDVVHGTTSFTGCKATWFKATDTPPTYGPLADGASVNGTVTVTMPDNTTDNQNACQNATPDVVVKAS